MRSPFPSVIWTGWVRSRPARRMLNSAAGLSAFGLAPGTAAGVGLNAVLQHTATPKTSRRVPAPPPPPCSAAFIFLLIFGASFSVFAAERAMRVVGCLIAGLHAAAAFSALPSVHVILEGGKIPPAHPALGPRGLVRLRSTPGRTSARRWGLRMQAGSGGSSLGFADLGLSEST